jgi:hypothetical protein
VSITGCVWPFIVYTEDDMVISSVMNKTNAIMLKIAEVSEDRLCRNCKTEQEEYTFRIGTRAKNS